MCVNPSSVPKIVRTKLGSSAGARAMDARPHRGGGRRLQPREACSRRPRRVSNAILGIVLMLAGTGEVVWEGLARRRRIGGGGTEEIVRPTEAGPSVRRPRGWCGGGAGS